MKRQKIIAIIVVMALVMCMFPSVSLALDIRVTDGSTLYLIGIDCTFTIEKNAHVTIIGSNTNTQIVCEEGVTLTLSDVDIDNSSGTDCCPLSFTGKGNTLILATHSKNTLKASQYEPAIRVEDGTELTIMDDGAEFSDITPGELNAAGGQFGAGIGGHGDLIDSGGDLGIINISGVIINATSYYGAGIGGGCGALRGGNGGTVNISGGNVTATGRMGAGIGGGFGFGDAGVGGIVNISGGTVTATGTDGAGIGGASGVGSGNPGEGGTVTISGGTVIASGPHDIGSGVDGGGGGTLSVDGAAYLSLSTGGTNAAVTPGDCFIWGVAAGEHEGAYIGGERFTGTIIDVATGYVIGDGASYTSPMVTIFEASKDYLIAGSTTSNKILVSTGTAEETDIKLFGLCIQPPDLSGTDSDCIFDISGSKVSLELYGKNTLTTYSNFPALQCPQGAALTISGSGSLNAIVGGSGSAGIGGGLGTDCGDVTISGGTIYALGGAMGAGIGGSDYLDGGGGGGTINITGGTVYASGGPWAPYDIGSGYGGSGGSLSISGNAAVFLRHNTSLEPTVPDGHTYTVSEADVTDYFGLEIPENWESGFGSYLRLYTLGYNANGGKGTPDSVTQLIGTTTPVAAMGSLEKTGYTPDSAWNTAADGSGTSYAPGATYTFNADATQYAQWTANTYKVDYDANGGTGKMASGNFTYDVSGVLTPNGFIRTGYTFAGWAASADGAAEYSDGQSILNLTAVNGGTVRLYAKWRANAFTVEYNANGGTGTMAPGSFTYDVSGALTPNGFIRTGYTFAGWAASVDGAAEYSDGQSIMNLTAVNGGTVRLYAKWKANLEISSSDSSGKIAVGGRIVLTPNIEGGIWSWDENFFSASFNSPATFTALKAGTSTITYTVNGISQSITVTIREAELPSTGQDFTWAWVLGALAVLCGGTAALTARKIRKKVCS